MFFSRPRELFLQVRETPDLKRALILLLIEAFVVSLPNIRAAVAGRTNLTAVMVASILAVAFMAVVGLAAMLWGASYTLIICRIFGSKPKFAALLSGLIYCAIPAIICGILRVFFSFKIDFLSLTRIHADHPLLREALRSIEPFRLWSAVMEVIATAVIAKLTYRRSCIIVFSLWIVGIILIYATGLSLGTGN